MWTRYLRLWFKVKYAIKPPSNYPPWYIDDSIAPWKRFGQRLRWRWFLVHEWADRRLGEERRWRWLERQRQTTTTAMESVEDDEDQDKIGSALAQFAGKRAELFKRGEHPVTPKKSQPGDS